MGQAATPPDAKIVTSLTSLENTVERLGNKSLVDAMDRTITWMAATANEEDVATRVLTRILSTPEDSAGGNASLCALHGAVKRGHAQVVQMLLNQGFAVDVEDSKGRQPLHYAALHGHLVVGKLLLDHGASADVKDVNGKFPRQFASQTREDLLSLFDGPV